MKLQGVIILRVTDLRRFFDLTEFWQQRDDFVEMIKQGRLDVFCDTEDERALCIMVRNWISIHRGKKDAVLLAEIKDCTLCFTDGSNKTFPLGLLDKFVEKIKGKLPHKDLVGLVCLYLLLGADKIGSGIKPEMGISRKQTSGEPSVNDEVKYIPLYGDCEFKYIDAPEYPFTRRVIANVSQNKITVKYGESIVEFSPDECAVALFCNANQCYKIFPHIADNHDGLKLCLKIDKSTGEPYLEEHNSGLMEPKRTPNVYSIAIEDGIAPVYVDLYGKLHFDSDCVPLSSFYAKFLKNAQEKDILAFERKGSGSFVFYTKNKINY